MARIDAALYKLTESKNIFTYSDEVDDNINNYLKTNFICPECYVKIAFNKGIDSEDPHFKNWPRVEHLSTCEILNFHKKNTSGSKEIERIISTIIKRSERLKVKNYRKIDSRFVKRNYGKKTKKFISTLASLTNDEIYSIYMRTEDKKTIKLRDLIMRQDEIIKKLDYNNDPFICILKGYTTKVIKVKTSIKIQMTFGGKYGNSRKFDLFIPSSYVEKNNKLIDTIENKLIYCYGLAIKNEFGYKMDLFSISNQIALIETKM